MDNLYRIQKLMEDVQRNDVNSYEYITEAETSWDKEKYKIAVAITKKHPAISLNTARTMVNIFGLSHTKDIPPKVMLKIMKNKGTFLENVQNTLGDKRFKKFISDVYNKTNDKSLMSILQTSRLTNATDNYLKNQINKLKPKDDNDSKKLKELYIDLYNYLKNRIKKTNKDLTGRDVLFITTNNDLIKGSVISDINYLTKEDLPKLVNTLDLINKPDALDSDEHVKNLKQKNENMLLVKPFDEILNENESNSIFKFIHRNWVFPTKYEKILKDKQLINALSNLGVSSLGGLAYLTTTNINKKELNDIIYLNGDIDGKLKDINNRLAKVGLDVTLTSLDGRNNDKNNFIPLSDVNPDEKEKIEVIIEVLKTMKQNMDGLKYHYDDMLSVDSEKIVISNGKKNMQSKSYGNNVMFFKLRNNLSKNITSDDITTLTIIFDNEEESNYFINRLHNSDPNDNIPIDKNKEPQITIQINK